MLKIYKGYEVAFLEKEEQNALTELCTRDKINFRNYNDVAQHVIQAFIKNADTLKISDKWITYEEFSVCYESLIPLIKTFGVEVKIFENNKYFNIYPIEIYDEIEMDKLVELQNKDTAEEEEISPLYSYIYKLGDRYFVQYHNYEYDYRETIVTENRYNSTDMTLRKSYQVDYIFEIKNEAEQYAISMLEAEKFDKIGIVTTIDTPNTREMKNGLIGYLKAENKEIYEYINQERMLEDSSEYKRIAIEEIGIPNFQGFKNIRIYKNPEEGNEIEEISQEEIINEIVTQINLCKNTQHEASELNYRDIFVTAPTGAGKSVMFQIPAVYAANKYGSITIIISPLVELMNDQVDNLKTRGYQKAARINSDINAAQKDEILKAINEGKIDLLYLSPEALLSYSIENIIGSRDISMIVVDEAHIVTTWGQGFRPDYWYLGTYIERLRRARYKGGKLDLNSKKYDFPVCTFTATSVFGGKDDGVLEIAESLYLKDPIRYIGEVRRNDIKFDINVNEDKLNQTETDLLKENKLQTRVEDWIEKKEKALVYFPYNSTATAAYEAGERFEDLSVLKGKVGIYTGKINKVIKRDCAEKYKKGDINIMFATKAFGMGIDIKDIKHVYHYAISGNLNDYIQEIGRAARSPEIEGIAHLDYYQRDMNYSKALFGMSAIKQYHVKAMLRILSNIYKKSKRRNNLITPQAFESVFPKSSDLENSVKTALLNIEKDMLAKYKIPVIITRPRSMFTSAYAVIDYKREEELFNSEFGKYFKKESEGRKSEKYDYGEYRGKCEITDVGNVYKVDLKAIWEDNFSNLSFPNFKHQYYSEREKIFGDFATTVCPRSKIEIQMVGEDNTFLGIKKKALEEIDKVSKILAKLQAQQGEFTLAQFKKELKEVYKDNVIAENIAQGYFKCIENSNGMVVNRSFYTRKNIGDIVKYKIVNSTYRAMAESLIYKNSLIAELDRVNKNKITKYKETDKETTKKLLKGLNLLALFNIIQYDIYGGENPEIFIRINDPIRISAIADEKISYENKIVKRAAEKHSRDIQIIEKFIKNLKTDKERWDYIEKYFLGEDVLES